MKKGALFSMVLLTITLHAKGADIRYPVSAIPEALTKNANAVVREHAVTFRINSQRSATESTILAITVLNAAGKEHAEYVLFYDKLIKVTTLRAAVYDAAGKAIKKVKSSDFTDQSAFNDLYSDTRAKMIDLSQPAYPYTVEVEYQTEYKFLFYIPTMEFIPDEKVSVQRASFNLIFPEDLRPRYNAQHLKQPAVESKSADGLTQLSWSVQDLAPLNLEPFGPGFSQQVPRVLAAPSKFEFEGYVGSMDTWKDFGMWINLLNKGRNQLPEATRAKVRELASKYDRREDKIRAVYNYMQGKTRYVSIQLGIGGFQPFDATVVDQNGYGDCKALSNYMVALLGAIDIKSHYVLINAGRNARTLIEDFPSTQFNHVVVAVPNSADTIWLECTSQISPFGFAGHFTGNRKALMITDDGARIVRTTGYPSEVNTQVTRATVDLQSNGNATANVVTRYSGLQYENGGLNFFLDDNFDQQKKWILKYTDIPSFDVKSFSMTAQKERIPSADVNLSLVLNRYASVSGKRVFMTPNLMNRWTYIPERPTARQNKVVMTSEYTDVDSVIYNLPENLYPEFLPQPMVHKSRFGEYEASVVLEAGRLIYRRKITMRRGEFPADSYPELVEFMKGLNRSDNMKMVFLNKT